MAESESGIRALTSMAYILEGAAEGLRSLATVGRMLSLPWSFKEEDVFARKVVKPSTKKKTIYRHNSSAHRRAGPILALTSKQVAMVKKLYTRKVRGRKAWTQAALARKFKVSGFTINNAVNSVGGYRP